MVQRFASWLSLFTCVSLLTMSVSVRAEDKPAAKPVNKNSAVQQLIRQKLAEKQAAPPVDPEEAAKAAEEAKERYKVPEGDAKELLTFITDNINFRPRTGQQMMLHRSLGNPAIRTATEKLQKIATDEDKRLAGYDDAIAYLLFLRSADAAKASPEELKALVTEIVAAVVHTDTPNNYAVNAARAVGRGLETRDPKMAQEVYRELGAALARNSDEKLAKIGASLEGSARRMDLPGNTMNITGTKTDGEKFDWSQYRGKVVLVDFWATWCGPCRAELPNVKKYYELYHDKGFDVVGISLDREREKLDDFLEKEALPWSGIYEGGGWETPMAVYYGISSIPRAILVDKEGKVVHMNARDKELGRMLAELLGPVEEPAEEKSEATAAEK